MLTRAITTVLRDSKLPDLKVPIFKGDYRQWQNFKYIFDAFIHNKQSLEQVHKMEYLKTFLEGEPMRLISPFTLTAQNYPDAYNLLRKRYDNERKLLTIHLDNMCNPVEKVASGDAIKELHDSISEGMTAIINMGIYSQSWGRIVVHFSISCLDSENRSQFEQKYCDNTQDIPDLKDFF